VCGWEDGKGDLDELGGHVEGGALDAGDDGRGARQRPREPEVAELHRSPGPWGGTNPYARDFPALHFYTFTFVVGG